MEAKKSPKAELETKKAYFTHIGLIISLTMMLIIFGWKTYDLKQIEIPTPPPSTETGIIDIPTIPKKLPPPPMPTTTLLNPVDNKQENVQDVKVDVGITPDTRIDIIVTPPPPPEEKQVIEEIIIVPDVAPCFPGGMENMYKFLAENLKYPSIAREANITGKVHISFVVEKDGRITDVRVLRGIGGGCDEEAARVISSMPRWTPGWHKGIPVRSLFNMPVKFVLN